MLASAATYDADDEQGDRHREDCQAEPGTGGQPVELPVGAVNEMGPDDNVAGRLGEQKGDWLAEHEPRRPSSGAVDDRLLAVDLR